MRLLVAILFIAVLFTVAVSCQVPECPPGYVCITQAAANRAAENARLVPVLEQSVTDLKAQLVEKDKSTDEIRKAGEENVRDLKAENTRLISEVSVKTGQLVGSEAMVTRLTAIVDFMLKNGREKCVSVICIQ